MCILLCVIFVCIALLLPLVLRFCLSLVFSACYHWWICFLVWFSLLSFFVYFFFFLITFKFLFIFNNFLFFYFNNFILFIFFLSFSPPFLSHVADRLLVLQLGVRAVPLRWESQVQDIGPPETSRLHVVSNSESSPRDLHLNAKTQLHSTTSKLQCWTPYAKELARQEQNPTH